MSGPQSLLSRITVVGLTQTTLSRRGCLQMPAVSTQQSHPAKTRAARLKQKTFPLLVLYILMFSIVEAIVFPVCQSC